MSCASICAWPSNASASLPKTRASDEAKPEGTWTASSKYFAALIYASFFCCQGAVANLSALNWEALAR